MKKTRKVTAVFLAVLLCVLTLLPAFASAVEYPDNISKTSVAGCITKLDNLALRLIASSSGKGLHDILHETLYSDKTLNSVFSAVFGELAGNENTLSGLGVNVTPAGLSAALSDFPKVSSAVAACPDLKTAVARSQSFVWDVSGKDGFADACAAMFSPFNNLLFALLCSGSVRINNYLAIKGADGYENAIVPVFTALECPGVMSQADFTASAAASRSNMVKNIVDMLCLSLDAIADAPVYGLTGVLPHIAWYLQSGGLTSSLNTLLSPLSLQVGIFTIPGISSLFSGIAGLENSADLSSLFDSVDIGALTGGEMELTLPDIDLNALAACGSVEGDTFTPDRADALMTVMYWLIDAAKLNADKLTAQAGAGASQFIAPLLEKDNDSLVKAIFVLLTAADSPRNKVAIYNYPAVAPAQVTYPEGLNADDLEKVVSGIDGLIEEIIKESDPEAEIGVTLRKTLYSGKVLATLMKGLYGALDGSEASSLFELLGLGTGTAAVAYALKDYPAAARTLRSASSWEKVDPENIRFGFADGDRAAFRKALVTVMLPLKDVLSFMLAGDTITVADAIEIRGTNGYSTVVIPLLEALGCENQTIAAYSAYAKTPESVITDVIDPILALTDRISERPVETLCSVLPNIIYFLNSGIVPEMIKNLLYPVTSLLEDAGLGEMLPQDMFTELSSFDINSMLKELDLSSLGIGFTLPAPDITKLASLGFPEERVSKMSSNGASIKYTYIVSDLPGVMMTLLRYLVGALASEENSKVLSDLMASGGQDDMMSMYAGNITSKFSEMTTDEIIVWLYGLFFRETPQIEIDNTPETIPTIIYDPDNSLTPLQIAGIFLGVIVLALAVIWILLQLGYLEGLQTKLDKINHAREKKKQDKKKKKQLAQMEKARNNANVVYSSQLDGAGRQNMKVASGAKKKAQSPAEKPSAPAAVPSARTPAPEVKKISANPLLSEKQNGKNARIQEKASMKALKNTKKADKYYEKALKKSIKR